MTADITEINSTATNSTLHFGGQRANSVPNNWLYHSFMIVLAVLIITHNIFVIYLYRRDRRLRCAANLLLTGLAASDLLTGMFVIPLTIASACLFGRSDIGTVLLYFFSNTTSDFGTMLIAFNLLLVTADRYFSLCYSLQYNDISRISRARKALLVVVIVCLILSCLPLCWNYKILINRFSKQERDLINKIETIYQIIYLCICFFVPAVIVLMTIVAMMITIRRLTGRKRNPPQDSSKKNTQVRAFIQFLLMYLSFLICWSPLMTIRLMITLNYDGFTRDDKLMLEVMFLLRCLTSLLNPGIHVWCKKDYRHAILVSKEKCAILLLNKRRRSDVNTFQSRGTTLRSIRDIGESSQTKHITSLPKKSNNNNLL